MYNVEKKSANTGNDENTLLKKKNVARIYNDTYERPKSMSILVKTFCWVQNDEVQLKFTVFLKQKINNLLLYL